MTDTRDRVLAAIRSAVEPLTVEELAEGLGIHTNTVRFHAAVLEGDGLVVHGRRPSGGKGRPRSVYSATELGARSGQRNFEVLADVLLRHLAATSSDPHAAAWQAGREWGMPLAVARRGRTRSPAGLLVDVLAHLDFEPSTASGRTVQEVRLHNCPFRELVDTHEELVCSLHAGMLDGIVAAHPRGGRVALEPLHTPTTCLVRYDSTSAPNARRTDSSASS